MDAPDQPVALNLRGSPFSILKSDLMELPESILLCLFPNGLVLNQPPMGQQQGGDGTDQELQQEENVYYVDFDGPCLEYILAFFERAKVEYYGTHDNPKRPYNPEPNPQSPSNPDYANPLFHKQAIIVLREELEYFVIPHKRPSSAIAEPGNDDESSFPATNAAGFPNTALIDLKKSVGTYLLQKHRSIFAALQRNVNREKNAAEQHLIEMLCMSGFGKDDDWGYRTVEPSRCCITSIALVHLKTGIEHATETGEANSQTSLVASPQTPAAPSINAQQLATAQKLLLFWRKPARKCWWDASEVEGMDSADGKPLKVWARRIWTLETVLL